MTTNPITTHGIIRASKAHALTATELLDLSRSIRLAKDVSTTSSTSLATRIAEAFRIRADNILFAERVIEDKEIKPGNYLNWVCKFPGDLKKKLGLSWGRSTAHVLGNILYQSSLYGTRVTFGNCVGVVVDFEDFVLQSGVGTADITVLADDGSVWAIDFTAMTDIPQDKLANIYRHVLSGMVDHVAIVRLGSWSQTISKVDLLKSIDPNKLSDEMRPGVKLALLLAQSDIQVKEKFVAEVTDLSRDTFVRFLDNTELDLEPSRGNADCEADILQTQSNMDKPWDYIQDTVKLGGPVADEVAKLLSGISLTPTLKPTLILGELDEEEMDLDLLFQEAYAQNDHELALSIMVLAGKVFGDEIVYCAKTKEDFFNRRFTVIQGAKPKHMDSKGKTKMSYFHRQWPQVKGVDVDCIFTVGLKSLRFKLMRNPVIYSGTLEKMEGLAVVKRDPFELTSMCDSGFVQRSLDSHKIMILESSKEPTFANPRTREMEQMASLMIEDPQQRAWVLSTIKTANCRLLNQAMADRELSYQICEVLDRAQGRSWFYPTLNSSKTLLTVVKTSQNLGTFSDVSYRAAFRGQPLGSSHVGSYTPTSCIMGEERPVVVVLPWLTMTRNMLEWKLKMVHHMILRVGLIYEHNKTVRPGLEQSGERLIDNEEMVSMLLPITVNRQHFSLLADATRYSYVGSTGAALDPKGLFSKMSGTILKTSTEISYAVNLIKQHVAISNLTLNNMMGRIMSKLSPGLPQVTMPETFYARVDPLLNTNLIYTKTIMNVEKTHTLAYEALDVLGLLEELEIYREQMTALPNHLAGFPKVVADRIMRAKNLADLIGMCNSAVVKSEYNEYVRLFAESGGKKIRYVWDGLATIAASSVNGSVNSLDPRRKQVDDRSLTYVDSLATKDLSDILGTEGSIELGLSNLKSCRKASGVIQLMHAVLTGIILKPAHSYARLRSLARRYPFMSITYSEAILYLMTSKLELVIRLFDKDQVGSNREISAMNAVGILLTKISEMAYSLRASTSEEDLIGNANKDAIVQSKIQKWMSLEGTLRVAFNKDCSRFGPNQMMPKFILHNALITSDPDTFAMISAAPIRMMSKEMIFPSDLRDQLLRDRGQYYDIAQTRKSAYAAVVSKIAELGQEMFFSGSIKMSFGMGQGLMGAQASHAHDDAIMFRRHIMSSSKKWSTTLKYEDHVVTSDDSTLLTCFVGIEGNFTKVARQFAQDDAWILLSFGLLTNTAKSVATTTSPEFNSEFTVKGKPIRSYVKMAHSLIDIPSGETPLSDLNFPSQQGRELLAHGGSVFMAFLLALLCMDLVVQQQNKRFMIRLMAENWTKYEATQGEQIDPKDLHTIRLAPELGGLPMIDPIVATLHPLACWVASLTSALPVHGQDREIALRVAAKELMTLKTNEEMATVGLSVATGPLYAQGVSGTLIMSARPSSKKKRLLTELGIGNITSFVEESVSYGDQSLIKNLILRFQETVVTTEEDLRKDTYFGKRLVSYHRDKKKIVYNASEDSLVARCVGHTRFSINDLNKVASVSRSGPSFYDEVSNPKLEARQEVLASTLLLVSKSIESLRFWRFRGGNFRKYPKEGNDRAFFESPEFKPNYVQVENAFVPSALAKRDKDGVLAQVAKENGVLSLIMFERYGRVLPRLVDTKGLHTGEIVFHTSEMQNQTYEKHLSRKPRLYKAVSQTDRSMSETLAYDLMMHNPMTYTSFHPISMPTPTVTFLPQHEIGGNSVGIIDQEQVSTNYVAKLARSVPSVLYEPPLYIIKPSDDMTRRGISEDTPLLLTSYQLKSSVNSSLLANMHGTGYLVSGTYDELLKVSLISTWAGSSSKSVKVFPIFTNIRGYVRETFRYAVQRDVNAQGTMYTTFLPDVDVVKALMSKAVMSDLGSMPGSVSIAPFFIAEVLEKAGARSHMDEELREEIQHGATDSLFQKIYDKRHSDMKIKEMMVLFSIANDVAWKIYAMAIAQILGVSKIQLSHDTIILVQNKRRTWRSYEDTIFSIIRSDDRVDSILLPLVAYSSSPYGEKSLKPSKLPKDLSEITPTESKVEPSFETPLWATLGNRSMFLRALIWGDSPKWVVNVANYAASLGLQGSAIGVLPQTMRPTEYVEHMSIIWKTNRIVMNLMMLLQRDNRYYTSIETMIGPVATFSMFCMIMLERFNPNTTIKADSSKLNEHDLPNLRLNPPHIKAATEEELEMAIANWGEDQVLGVIAMRQEEDSASYTSDVEEESLDTTEPSGMRVQKIVGDGNCFLRSVHSSLLGSAIYRPNGVEVEFEDFKARALDSISRYDFSKLPEGSIMEGVDPVAYFRGLIKRTQWAGQDFDYVPIIISDSMGINILITTDTHTVNLNPEGEMLALITYNGRDHYDAIIIEEIVASD
jgi:hypothetical protein